MTQMDAMEMTADEKRYSDDVDVLMDAYYGAPGIYQTAWGTIAVHERNPSVIERIIAWFRRCRED